MAINAPHFPYRPLVLALFAAAAIGLGTASAWTWVHLNNQYAARITGLLETVARTKARIARRTLLEERYHQLKTQWYASDYFIHRDTFALAAVELQERVQHLTHKTDGALISYQVFDPVKEHDRLRVSLRFRIEGDERDLLRILHGLESGHPALFVDNLNLQANSAAAPHGAQPPSKRLKIAFDLTGYLPGESG